MRLPYLPGCCLPAWASVSAPLSTAERRSSAAGGGERDRDPPRRGVRVRATRARVTSLYRKPNEDPTTTEQREHTVGARADTGLNA